MACIKFVIVTAAPMRRTVFLIVDVAQILGVADKGDWPEALAFSFVTQSPTSVPPAMRVASGIAGIPLGQFIGGARAKNIIAALKGWGLWRFSHPRGHRELELRPEPRG